MNCSWSRRRVMTGMLVAVLVVAGCSSSKTSSKAASTPAGSTQTAYKVGLLVDETGAGASGNKTAIQGAEAGAAWAATQGYDIKLEIADTQTSPSGALAGAQRLIEQDKVPVVMAVSALTFAAAPFLTSHGVPVIGAAEDGQEWLTSSNMFSVIGLPKITLVPSAFGALMKMEGGTNLGSIGYSISPGSADAAKAAALSAEAAGLKAGYVNANFPFGSTNVQPAVLGMKAAGVDSFTAATDPNTAFAFITSLRQEGVNLKFVLLDDGYGSDLLQSGPGATAAAQGVYFELGAEPVEMHTPATEQFVKYLSQVGVTGEPDFAMYNGYESVLMLVEALKAAGKDATSAELLGALSNIHAFSGGGLFGNQSLDLTDRTGTGNGILKCVYVTKFEGSSFQLVPGADPICGTIVPGLSVTSGS